MTELQETLYLETLEQQIELEFDSCKRHMQHVPNPLLPAALGADAHQREDDLATADGMEQEIHPKWAETRADLKSLNDALPEEITRAYQIVDRIGEGPAFHLFRDHLRYIDISYVGTFSTVYKAIDHFHDHYDNHAWENASNGGFGFVPVRRNADGQFLFTAKRFVAIKKIYVTSSPARILSEISMLKELKGEHNVIPIISAVRHLDQVLVIMPYFEHQDFRVRQEQRLLSFRLDRYTYMP